MVHAKIDEKQLLRSLRRAGKAFGDTSAQATIRWGVMTARELAKQTQAWGEGGKPEQKQRGAIFKDALNVVTVTESVRRLSSRTLADPQAVVDWIEINRTRRGARTAKLPDSEKRFCSPAVFAGAIKIKMTHAGMAKGGWIGAGNALGRHQSGSGRISIGSGFLPYAQKHADMGSAVAARSGFSPVSQLRNKSRHSSAKTVLSDAKAKSATMWGLRKTIKWYEKAAKSALDKS